MTHLYILYLVEKPCRFFSTKSMYSGEWWKGPLSDRSQSRGPPGLSLGRLAVAAAITADRKHTQQWRLRLMTPHRAIRDGGSNGGVRVVMVGGAFSSRSHSSLAGSSTGMTGGPASPQRPRSTLRKKHRHTDEDTYKHRHPGSVIQTLEFLIVWGGFNYTDVPRLQLTLQSICVEMIHRLCIDRQFIFNDVQNEMTILIIQSRDLKKEEKKNLLRLFKCEDLILFPIKKSHN